ncbi:hypothetical protein QP794_09880 [Paenibacillus sp. UMB7766-LJ446]|uniref:hypothetical protein n=1 Tax=Paenibacillus sp. UMB7766-LJ446 TaxID=3046313 RepID=UPI00254AFEF7|nr:hypothetical protein [Paenibacillus sp. UMB7766-LJ446]MDK8190395.1 hypothetical protein [Paenibacillus sp. UMB7766-LJ446]
MKRDFITFWIIIRSIVRLVVEIKNEEIGLLVEKDGKLHVHSLEEGIVSSGNVTAYLKVVPSFWL